jgi:hypothetical protein
LYNSIDWAFDGWHIHHKKETKTYSFPDFFRFVFISPPLFLLHRIFIVRRCDRMFFDEFESTLNHLILLSLSFLFEIASSIQLFCCCRRCDFEIRLVPFFAGL